MNKVRVISSVLATLLASAATIGSVYAAPTTTLAEVGIGVGSTNDALFAIENNRISIVDRILNNFDSQLKSGANNAASVRNSLLGLRADQLLSASLSNSLPDVMLILAEPVAVGPATHRYVAVAPTSATSFAFPEGATSFVLRNNDDLSLARVGELTSAAVGATVVGYFVRNVGDSASTVFSSAVSSRLAKDGLAQARAAGSASLRVATRRPVQTAASPLEPTIKRAEAMHLWGQVSQI